MLINASQSEEVLEAELEKHSSNLKQNFILFLWEVPLWVYQQHNVASLKTYGTWKYV